MRHSVHKVVATDVPKTVEVVRLAIILRIVNTDLRDPEGIPAIARVLTREITKAKALMQTFL